MSACDSISGASKTAGQVDAVSGASKMTDRVDAVSGASKTSAQADAISGASKSAVQTDAVSGASRVVDSSDYDAVSGATRWCMGRKRDRQVPLPGQSLSSARESGLMVDDAASRYNAEGGLSEVASKSQDERLCD